jgi:hypothetical protein
MVLTNTPTPIPMTEQQFFESYITRHCEGKSPLIAPEELLFTYSDMSNLYAKACLFTGFQDSKGNDLYGGDIVKEWISDNMEPEGGFWNFSRIEKLHGCWVVNSITFDYSKSNFPHDFVFLYEEAQYEKVDTRKDAGYLELISNK